MNASLLALLLLTSQVAPTAPCERGADCGAGAVCVANQCRTGSARATVRVLASLAVPTPVLVGHGGGLEARATALARQVEHALRWTGFYTVVPAQQHPRVPSAQTLTGPSRAVWGAFGVERLVRLTVGHGLDVGSVSVTAEVIDLETGRGIRLGPPQVQIPPGADRRAVAAWANGLVGHDTGLPGCVGSRLLVSVQVAPGHKEIAVVDFDGSGLSFVTRNGSINVAPAWGPNGSVGYMSYLRRNPDWIVNGQPFSTRTGLNAAGDWSPDGRVLALSLASEANSDIVLLDAGTGEELERLTSHPAVDTSPAWSPDGRRIAFVSDRTGSPQIWIHDVQTRAAERLNEGGYMASPVWSPLGDVLVYVQLMAGRGVLVRRDLDTGKVEHLTEPGTNAESPTISPDGRYVVFVRRTQTHRAGLWRIPLRGGTAMPLAQQAWPLYAPDWQP